MGKSKGSSTVTTGPDAATQQRIQQLWGAANGAASTPLPGVDPLTQQAGGYYGRAAGAGDLGMRALSGDQGALSGLLNPYTDNVVNAYQQDAAHTLGTTMNGVNSDATLNGAFGGSRADVARGVAGANIARDTNSQIAQLRQSGFNDAMGRAGTLANLGFGAAGQMAQLGDYQRQVALSQNPQLRQFQAYQQAMGLTPNGQTQTTTQNPGHNMFSGALGGILGMAGAGFTGGVPLALGGLLGAFG